MYPSPIGYPSDCSEFTYNVYYYLLFYSSHFKFFLNANGYTNILNAIANKDANIAAKIANTIPNMKNMIFTAIRNINPSKLNSKIIPGSLTNPQDVISSHISVMNVLFKIIVAIKQYANTPTTKIPNPVEASPLANVLIPLLINISATHKGQINE